MNTHSAGGLPRAHGGPVVVANMRSTAEDFIVEELQAFDASGSGEHLLLFVEKRGMNTAFAAKRLAEWAGIKELGVGYAGLKDRHAVTRQRFSVHLPKKVAPDMDALQSDDLRVLAHDWHVRKLPRGALAGNQFELTLRQVRGERETIDRRLQQIGAHGVPNYFGEQRFGHGGGNIDAALAMFSGRRMRRDQRTHLLSAARSQLFNQVLAARVEAGNWNQALDGEVWILDGSRSVFGPEAWNDVLEQRLSGFDIHPSAPLWGRGTTRATGAAAELEAVALADEQSSALRAGLETAGLKQERRATRLRPQDLAWDWLDGTTLQLRFALPPGTYATTVLAELGDISDAAMRPS